MRCQRDLSFLHSFTQVALRSEAFCRSRLPQGCHQNYMLLHLRASCATPMLTVDTPGNILQECAQAPSNLPSYLQGHTCVV